MSSTTSITVPLNFSQFGEHFELDAAAQLIYMDYHIKSVDETWREVIINLTPAESRQIRKALKQMERKTRKWARKV
ncbi:hypothetical protein ACFU99_00600 [Streptomyces sp. NPDC057654]|uniref:hypothetical protein n=1 Tax=Streptomyces sp. NPDC057654 TaxID=3346196 RepID=UPI0036A183B9